jgi:hypothetical protein
MPLGRVIFGTPHTQIMVLNFAAGMESCPIKHQALCNGFIIIHFSLQGLERGFAFRAILSSQFVSRGKSVRFHAILSV